MICFGYFDLPCRNDDLLFLDHGNKEPIDYDKAVPLVLLEALLIAFFWVFIASQLPKLLNRSADTNRKLISLIGILLAVVIGMGLTFAFPAGN